MKWETEKVNKIKVGSLRKSIELINTLPDWGGKENTSTDNKRGDITAESTDIYKDNGWVLQPPLCLLSQWQLRFMVERFNYEIHWAEKRSPD